MEINRRDFITKVSAIAALSVLPSSFVAAMGNEKVEKAPRQRKPVLSPRRNSNDKLRGAANKH